MKQDTRPILEVALTAKQFIDLWPKLRPFIDECVAGCAGEYTAEDVRQDVKDGTARPFAIMRASDGDVLGCFITRDLVYRAGFRSLEMWVLAGKEFHLWARSFSRSVEENARRLGYGRIETHCVPALVPHLKRCGMTHLYAFMIKDL